MEEVAERRENTLDTIERFRITEDIALNALVWEK